MKTKRAAKLSLAIAIIAIVTGIVFVFTGCKTITPTYDSLFSVNGFQQWTNHKDIKTVDNAKLTTVEDMLNATGLSMDKDADKKQIAENIFNLSVDNYGKIINKAYWVSTTAGVTASDVHAKVPVLGTVDIPNFDVVLKSNYTAMTGSEGSFNQTISGVQKLTLEGWLEPIGNTIKGAFGYNIQEYSDDNIRAFRRAGNGAYDFIADEAKATKYILGATAKFPGKPTKDTTWDNKNSKTDTFIVEKIPAGTAAESKDATDRKPWDPLEENQWSDFSYVIDGEENNFVKGNFGSAGWATYNFSSEYLSDKTTVEYDAKAKVYKLTMVVKDDMVDDACKFAKGALVSDTEQYVRLNQPKYTELSNVIEVFENGLIKSWDRTEKLGSDKRAELLVLPGSCDGGGTCSNTAKTVFSYADVDCNAKSLAARYWPQLGDAKIIKDASLRLDLSKYDTIDTYKPKLNA